ncbi:MAG TPA: hypothetical protein PKL83_01135, partial [bacterium]|nr:hypothetical protein [bacterium]
MNPEIKIFKPKEQNQNRSTGGVYFAYRVKRLQKAFAAVLCFLYILGILPVGQFALLAQAQAAITNRINYQGRLADSNGNLLGGSTGAQYCFRFAFYDDEVIGGADTKIWPDDANYETHDGVTVTNGVFNLQVGEFNSLAESNWLSDQGWDDRGSDVWVQVWVGANGCTGMEQLSPRQQITSVGMAQEADRLDGYEADEFAVRDENETISGDWNFTGALNVDNTVDLDVDSTTAFTIGDGANDLVTVDTTNDTVSFADSDASGDVALRIDAAANQITIGEPDERVDVTQYGDTTLMGKVDLVTTGMSGVTDVFVYDTTKDIDGGRWTNDEQAQASSWFNEALSEADRCNSSDCRRTFPQKAIIVATTSAVTIFDAEDNSQWMVFTDSAADALMDIDPAAVYALNGFIYIAGPGNADDGLYALDYINDRIVRWDDDAYDVFNGTISARNDSASYTEVNTSDEIIADDVNDVHATVIDGQHYVAVATDAGFSVINATTGRILDYADTVGDDYNAVWLSSAGTVYAVNETTAALERWDAVQADSADENPGTPDMIWDESTIPALVHDGGAPGIQITPDQLAVLTGVSSVDGVSDRIAFGHADGVTILEDNRADERNGAVQYLTSGYITEKLYGDVQGMWGFNSSLADRSAADNDLSAAGATIAYPSGVRGTGLNITVADATATVASQATNYSMGIWVEDASAGWEHYVKTNAGEYKNGELVAGSFTNRLTWVGTTVTIVAGAADVDEAFVTNATLTPGHIKRLYETGRRAASQHTASRVTGITGTDDYQKLHGAGASAGTVDTVTAVQFDDSGSYLYVGTADGAANTGGVTVVGITSDSVVDLYDSANNTAKDDDAGTQFDANDVVAFGITGKPCIGYNSASTACNQESIIALAGSNDAATRVWMERSDYSIYATLAALTSTDLFKEMITASEGLRIWDPDSLYRTDISSSDGNVIISPAFEITASGGGSVRGSAFQGTSIANVLKNGSFESDGDNNGIADQWTNNSLTASSDQSTTNKYGEWSQDAYADAASDNIAQSITKYDDYAGIEVTASVYIYQGTASENVRLEVTDGVNTSYVEKQTSNSWQRIWLTHRVDKNPTELTIKIYPARDGSGNSLIDAAMVQEGALLSQFSSPEFDVSAISGDLLPAADDTFDIGSDTMHWQDLYLDGTIYFENDGETDATITYDEPGDFLAFNIGGGANEVTLTGTEMNVSTLLDIDVSATNALTVGDGSNDTVVVDTANDIVTIQDSDASGDDAMVVDAGNDTVTIGEADERVQTVFYGEQTIKGKKDIISSAATNDVFVYDTTKDVDGGAWTSDERATASSWFNEASSATRCPNGYSAVGCPRAFPGKALLVVTDSGLDVYEAKTNQLWMRFSEGAGYALGSSDITLSSVYAHNGKIYLGDNNSTDALGLIIIDLITDRIELLDDDALDRFDSTLDDRNSNTGYTQVDSSLAIVSDTVNDVHVNLLQGKTYVALATGAGVSIWDVSGKQVVDYDEGDAGNATDDVWLTGDGELYYNDVTAQELLHYDGVWQRKSDQTAATVTYDENEPAAGPVPFTTATNIRDLYITEGTSAADNRANTIYLASDLGVAVIHENQSAPADGTVKYYTTEYITDMMPGDVRLMLPMTENTASTTVNDRSVKNNTVTSQNNTSTLTQSGVRGAGFEFNGTDDGLTIINDADFDFTATENIAISLWIRLPDTSGEAVQLIDSFNASTGFQLSVDTSGFVVFQIGDGTQTPSETGSIPVDDDSWHHIVAIRNVERDRLEVWTDGMLNDSPTADTTTADLTTAANLVIGEEAAGDNEFTGDMDDLLITAEVLNEQQIRRMHTIGRRALEQHTSSRLTEVSAADGYQRLACVSCTSNRVETVAVDDSYAYLYIGLNDQADNAYGSLSVIGLDSDTLVDVYGQNSSNTTSDAGTIYGSGAGDPNAPADIKAVSLSGVPCYSFNGSSSDCDSRAVVAVAGEPDNADGTYQGSTIWTERADISLEKVLDDVTSTISVKDTVIANQTLGVYANRSDNTLNVYEPIFEVGLRLGGTSDVAEFGTGYLTGSAWGNQSFANLVFNSSFENDNNGSNDLIADWDEPDTNPSGTLEDTSAALLYQETAGILSDTDADAGDYYYVYQTIADLNTENIAYKGRTFTYSLWYKENPSNPTEALRIGIYDGVNL